MSEMIYTVLGGLVLLLLSLLGWEKKKTKKEQTAKERAETEVSKLKLSNTVQQQANEIKNELAARQKENAQEQEAVEAEIDEIPEENKEELSDEVKKLAADQYHRTHAHAGGVLDDTD